MSQPAKQSSVLIHANDLDKLPPVVSLAGTHILEESLNVLFGQSGSYKSFYAVDVALRIAQTKAVVYVAAEGVRGFNGRVSAWRKHNKLTAGHLYFHLREVDLRSEQEVNDFRSTIGRGVPLPIALVVFDTLARCIPGADENSAKDIGLAIRTCTQLQRDLGTAVLLVHHSGKSGGSERGSSALRGAADAMILMSAHGDDAVTVTCDKLKDGAPWPNEEYKLEPVSGTDSGVLVLGDASWDDDRLGPQEWEILKALLAAPRHTASAAALMEQTGLPKSTVHRHLKDLEKKGMVEHEKNKWRLSQSGRETVEPLEVEVDVEDTHESQRVSPSGAGSNSNGASTLDSDVSTVSAESHGLFETFPATVSPSHTP